MKAFSADARATASRAHDWHSPEAIPESARPGALWSWLVEPASLTARLRRHCGERFGVRVLSSGPAALTVDEAAWIGHDHGFVREVHLCCGATPWVRACTIAVNGGGPEARLQKLGREPLGDRAFEQSSTRRDALQIACLDSATNLWSRRSILHIGDEALYISECFLNDSTPWGQ